MQLSESGLETSGLLLVRWRRAALVASGQGRWLSLDSRLNVFQSLEIIIASAFQAFRQPLQLQYAYTQASQDLALHKALIVVPARLGSLKRPAQTRHLLTTS